jgi:hypothetical protein
MDTRGMRRAESKFLPKLQAESEAVERLMANYPSMNFAIAYQRFA